MTSGLELGELLRNLQPQLQDGEYVFCSVSEPQWSRLEIKPRGTFREREGVTLILDRAQAEAAELDCRFVSKMITLEVKSDLDSVGLLAAVAASLAEAGVSLNPVAAYHHDHLFVPAGKATQAMRALENLVAAAKSGA